MGSGVDIGGDFAIEIPIESNALTEEKQWTLCATTGLHWTQRVIVNAYYLQNRLLCPPQSPLDKVREIIFFILINLSINAYNFKIGWEQLPMLHCQ